MTQKQQDNILKSIQDDIRDCSKLTTKMIQALEAYLKKTKDINYKTKSSQDI